MKKMKKAFYGVLVLTVVMFAIPAFAATVTVSNAVGQKLSLAFCYTDTSGETVTKGWWHVAPDSETTVTLDADSSKPIYYAAFNKDLYADSSTIKGPKATGPLSYRMFTYSVGSDEGDFESKFFKVPDDGAVEINGNSRGNR